MSQNSDPEHPAITDGSSSSEQGAAVTESSDPQQGFDLEELDDAVDAFFEAVAGPNYAPVNWRTLPAEDAEHDWLTLNDWVNWLRTEFSLPPSVVPPAWHRHPELVWELSALHLRWLGAHDPDQNAAGPLAFMVDFHAARRRLREWVTLSGTRLDVDRPSRRIPWPGESLPTPTVEIPITDREEDFVAFVLEDVAQREVRESRG